jgi:hypothetical protein
MPYPCRAHAALCRGLEKSFSEWHGRGMACVNQTLEYLLLFCILQAYKRSERAAHPLICPYN